MLVIRGQKFNFRIDPNSPTPASYNSFNNNLTFRSTTNIDEPDVVREELFHGYQNSFYSGGISQYSNQGRSNIEFESKLYKDLLNLVEGNGGGAFTGIAANNFAYDSYVLWLRELTSNFIKYPSVINMNKYDYFLEAFKQSFPEYDTPSVSNMKPDALMNAILGSPCSH